MFYNFYVGDSLEVLKTFESNSIHCCVTSPPYWGIRDYGNNKQIGLEDLPIDYINSIVNVFRELKRVIRNDGTVWLNLGDCFATSQKGGGGKTSRLNTKWTDDKYKDVNARGNPRMNIKKYDLKQIGLPEKSIMGIPWRVAFALQEDGWLLRQDIVWKKTSVTPESAEDRFTKEHEYIFLLTKNSKYFFDGERLREKDKDGLGTKNKRTVWHVSNNTIRFNHTAVMPFSIADICVKAGTSEKGCCSVCGTPIKRIVDKKLPPFEVYRNTSKKKEWLKENQRETIGWKQTCNCKNIEYVPCTVIDPFCGSGTTIVSALKNNCNGIGIDLNSEYIAIAEERVKNSGENQ